MDATRILADLRAEHERIGSAIVAMERIVNGSGKRRGRPPNWMKDLDKKNGSGPKAGKVKKTEA